MITPLHPFEDTRVLHTVSHHQVLAQRDAITLRDGSTVHLHPVAAQGHRLTFHRAMATATGQWHIFDLRHLCAAIENDMLALPSQDTPGVVLYSLRLHHASSRALHVAIADASNPNAPTTTQAPLFEAA
jgi:hypothetical protein